MTTPVLGMTPAIIKQRAFDARVAVCVVLNAAGVSGNTLWRWEKGLNVPQKLTVAKIMDAIEAIEAGQVPKRRQPSLTKDEREVICERAKYQTPSELAKVFGISYQAVTAIIRSGEQ